jgi:hypothetical protein
LSHRRHPLLANEFPLQTNTQATIKELLGKVFSVESAPKLYNEDPKSAEKMIERELSAVCS